MVDIDNNRLIGLIIISWGDLLLSQGRKQRQGCDFGKERQTVKEHITQS